MTAFWQKMRVAAALGALALVAGLGAASLGRDCREVLGWSLDEHRRALTASRGARIRAVLGPDFEFWQALEAHVPAHARLLVSYPRSIRNRVLFRRLQHLRALRCPADVRGFPYRQQVSLVRGKRRIEEYVLDLESGRDFSAYPRCEELARGKRFRLLLVGSAAR